MRDRGLLVTTHEGVRTLVLSRPERGNALSADMVEALLDGALDAYSNPQIHTLVIRAEGKHFCTGFDVSGLETQSDGDLLQRFVRIETLLATIWHAPIRTVAIADGRVWGAGADLFATCDIRVAGQGANFRFPGAAFGLVLGTRRLAERIGVDHARQCAVSGLRLDAAKATELGLVTDLVESLATEAGEAVGGPAEAVGAQPGNTVGSAAEAVGAQAVGIKDGAMVGSAFWATAPSVDRPTLEQLHQATRADHRDADLASLVRSASRPGLKERLVRYRAGQRA